MAAGFFSLRSSMSFDGLFADCTYSGAEFLSKKSLNSAQNLENKGPDFFLPCRSMVLKVVTGKIF
jgi:hypothetical protein